MKSGLAENRGAIRLRRHCSAALVVALTGLGCANESKWTEGPRAPRVQSSRRSSMNDAPGRHRPQRVPFVSFNVPNLHYVEDDWRFTSMLRYRLPNEFEIHDALQSVALMGGTVVRTYTLSVRKPTDTPQVVRHVLGPGQFHEEAFVTLDRVLANASELGVRVILPLVDNWSYWGGVAEYAAFRGKPRQDFFKDAQLIADFERTVAHVLLRTNTLNGRAYRADPTIYAWETGNELGSPDAWSSRIAGFIKQHDSEHPVIDGTYGPRIREHALTDSNIDIVSSHHYAPVAETLAAIDENVRLIRGRKRYLIGEFGLLTAADTERVLRHAVNQPIDGILLWSLRSHNRDGGFYHHMEKPPFQAYHFPGSLLGHDYEEQGVMRLMRHFAFSVRREEVPVLPAPAAPSLLPVSPLGEVRWRGSVGARHYVIERQTDHGIWEIVATRVDEAQTPYRAGYVDETAPIGATVRYRVVAANETGLSQPSLPSEEVRITGRLSVDEMTGTRIGPTQNADSSTLGGEPKVSGPMREFALEGPAEFTTEHAELCKMDRDRLRGRTGARLRYRTGRVGGVSRATAAAEPHGIALRVFAFAQDPGRVFEISWSSNGRDFTRLASDEQSFAGAVDQPRAFRPVLCRASSIPRAAIEVAITWQRTAEIGRVEMQSPP